MDQDQHYSSEEDTLSSDEEETILITLALNAQQQLQRKQRKVWVHNLNIERPDVAANSLSVTFKMLQVTGKVSGRK